MLSFFFFLVAFVKLSEARFTFLFAWFALYLKCVQNCAFALTPILSVCSISFAFRLIQRETASMGKDHTFCYLFRFMYCHLYNIQKFDMDRISHWRCSRHLYFYIWIMVKVKSTTSKWPAIIWTPFSTTKSIIKSIKPVYIINGFLQILNINTEKNTS